jgi:hypothetical protein
MRSMVEGYLARPFAVARRTLPVHCSYPSTTLRVVPLPMLRMGRNMERAGIRAKQGAQRGAGP